MATHRAFEADLHGFQRRHLYNECPQHVWLYRLDRDADRSSSSLVEPGTRHIDTLVSPMGVLALPSPSLPSNSPVLRSARLRKGSTSG
jgi:hypothetical protein